MKNVLLTFLLQEKHPQTQEGGEESSPSAEKYFACTFDSQLSRGGSAWLNSLMNPAWSPCESTCPHNKRGVAANVVHEKASVFLSKEELSSQHIIPRRRGASAILLDVTLK